MTDLIQLKDVSKKTLQNISKEITNTINPLETFIKVKALETICKEIVSDKSFRDKVKENYLYISGGAIDKQELFGVTVSTISQVKKVELAKDYIYSDEVSKLQSEIENLELELKTKKDLLKGKKLIEINNGTAKEIMSDFVDVPESDLLKEFDLKITFK